MKAEDAPSETMRDKVHDWFKGTMSSRLNNPRTGSIVLLAQRLHVDDLVGRLAQTGDWELLNLPARAIQPEVHEMGDGAIWRRATGGLLHPERLGEEELDSIRRELGSAAYEAQYQQSPVLPGGNLVKTNWFRTYKGARRSSDYEAVLQSWDTASVPGINNDYSVCTTWGLINEQVDLLHVHRAQHDYPDLLREARAQRKKWRPSLIVVEQAGVGIALGNELWRDGLRDVQALAPKENKVERMSVQCAKLEQGQVGVPEHAPWLEAYLQEMGAFPNSKFDDQVDSTSQALLTLDKRPLQLRHISRCKL
jgi:predicted phage terminase large subunit-like protein